MQRELGLIVLTKIKDNNSLFGHSGKTLSTHVTNNLTQVSITVEDRLIIPITSISHHPHHGHFHFIPITGISHNVLQLSTNNQIIL
jgi:hypothetical protein